MSHKTAQCVRLAEFEDLEAINRLMQKVFSSQMQAFYSEEGRNSLMNLLSLRALQKRFLEDNRFYVYELQGRLEGVIELEHPCHIAFLFVQTPRKGIARRLCDEVLAKSKEEIVTVGAFSQAIGFYTKLGFKKVSQEQRVHGLPFTLMAKRLA